MLKHWIEAYEPKNTQETEQALREIMQEITLAGLHRSGFFKYSAFYGGTALRIFHGLNRFSEDLDFSLLEKNPDFRLDPFLKELLIEFESFGIKIEVKQKLKSHISNIESAFLKNDTLWSELILDGTIEYLKGISRPNIKIKLEVDINPPLAFQTEDLLLTRPYSMFISCLTLPNLFAGKLHALLFRKWKNRVKGRDWFDFEWYLKQGTPLNLQHFALRAFESGDWPSKNLSKDELMKILTEKIDTVDINQIKSDVTPFIESQASMEIWSKPYFSALINKLKIQ
jgi:predicted nucleotidyltransferase component of viral defense system